MLIFFHTPDAPPPVNGRTDYTFSYSATPPPALMDGQIAHAYILPHPLLLLCLLTDGQITLAHILPHPLLLLPLLVDGQITLAHKVKKQKRRERHTEGCLESRIQIFHRTGLLYCQKAYLKFKFIEKSCQVKLIYVTCIRYRFIVNILRIIPCDSFLFDSAARLVIWRPFVISQPSDFLL